MGRAGSESVDRLGGVGVPADLGRDVRLDGSVLCVGDGFAADSGLRAIGALDRWRIVDAADAPTAKWLASIHKTSLIAVGSDDRRLIIDVLRAVREVSAAAVVVIGALDDVTRTEVLLAGADLVLPAGIDELELRAQIHALLRRAGETWEPSVRFLGAGEILVDLWSRVCTVGDRVIALSPIEFRLLEYLMRHAHQALPAGKIVQRVWGTGYAADLNALRLHVSRLRRKLAADAGGEAPVIRSVRGIGYEFTANVLEMGDGSTPDTGQQHVAVADRLLEAGRMMPTASVAAAAEYLTGSLVESGACDASAIFELRGERLTLFADRGNSERWKRTIAGGVPLRAAFAQALAIRTQRPTQVADIQLHAQPYAETARILADEGFHSCLFVPILVEHGTWGGLGLASRSRRPFDPLITTYCIAVAAMFGIVARTAAV